MLSIDARKYPQADASEPNTCDQGGPFDGTPAGEAIDKQDNKSMTMVPKELAFSILRIPVYLLLQIICIKESVQPDGM
jgi:hypothetical protein